MSTRAVPLDAATREGRRPRRPCARGVKGQRGRCPSNRVKGRRPRRPCARGVKGQRGRCPSNRVEGRRPRRPCARGVEGQRGRCPSNRVEGRRPRRPCARGVEGQRGRCPSNRVEGRRPRRPCARGIEGQRGRCPSISLSLVAVSKLPAHLTLLAGYATLAALNRHVLPWMERMQYCPFDAKELQISAPGRGAMGGWMTIEQRSCLCRVRRLRA